MVSNAWGTPRKVRACPVAGASITTDWKRSGLPGGCRTWKSTFPSITGSASEGMKRRKYRTMRFSKTAL